MTTYDVLDVRCLTIVCLLIAYLLTRVDVFNVNRLVHVLLLI